MQFKLSRSDYLTLRITLALFVLLALSSPLIHAWNWIRMQPLIWLNSSTPHPLESKAPIIESANGLTVRWSTETLSWEFAQATWSQRLGTLLPGLLVAAVVLWLCLLIWRFVGLIERDQAFSPGAHRLLVRFGIALACLTPAMLLGEMAATMLIYAGAVHSKTPFALLSLNGSEFISLGASMVVLVLAHAWRKGEYLAEEVEATI